LKGKETKRSKGKNGSEGRGKSPVQDSLYNAPSFVYVYRWERSC